MRKILYQHAEQYHEVNVLDISVVTKCEIVITNKIYCIINCTESMVKRGTLNLGMGNKNVEYCSSVQIHLNQNFTL